MTWRLIKYFLELALFAPLSAVLMEPILQDHASELFAQTLSKTWFHYLSFSLFGFGLGILITQLTTRFSTPKPSKAERFGNLHYRISQVRHEIWGGLKDDNGSYDFNRKNHSTQLQLDALYSDLKDLGLKPPNLNSKSNIEYNLGNSAALQALETASEHGQLKHAKAQIKVVIQECLDAARAQNLTP